MKSQGNITRPFGLWIYKDEEGYFEIWVIITRILDVTAQKTSNTRARARADAHYYYLNWMKSGLAHKLTSQ